MKNLNISFQEEQNSIKYEEYFFNGIQIPKDIEIKDININSFKLNWKIDNINIINMDNKQIKYKVEIRKENENEKFIKVYEGNNTNCLIDKLDKNTNYEIRICSIYNNLIGKYGNIQKVKTTDCDFNCDSVILNSLENKNEYLKKIYDWTGYTKMDLLYRGTRDGSTANIFHNKCDNKGPTLCLYQNDKNNIFGGFASISWTSDQSGNYFSAPESFLFTLTNIHGTKPEKFPNSEKNNSVYHYKDYGTLFGANDLFVRKDFMNQNTYSAFPSYYQDTLGKGKSIFTGNANNNITDFKVKEIEIYKIFK